MQSLTNVKVGDEVVHFYTGLGLDKQAVVYKVVKETPKRLVIKRHNIEYQVAKGDGKVIGANFFVRPIGDKEQAEIERIKEQDKIRQMRRELIEALEKNRLTDDQVEQMYVVVGGKWV